MKQDKDSATATSESLAQQETKKTDAASGQIANKWEKVRSKENDNETNEAHHSTHETQAESESDQIDSQELIAQNKALHEKVKKLESDLKSIGLYHAAELKNPQTRAVQDNEKARNQGYEKAIQEIIPLDDSLYASLNYTNGTAEQYREGAQHIVNQLKNIFEKLGITVISPAVGDNFDPYIHTAAGTELVDQKLQAPDTIVKVFQKGYRLKERIIRPAMVIVSKVEKDLDSTKKNEKA